MTVAEFRLKFPEFSDGFVYPEDSVAFWLGLAEILLPAARWKALRPAGLALYTAHNLTLDRQSSMSGRGGAAPGVSTGVVASKSVGAMSISYDATAGMDALAGSWNLTAYGRRVWTLIRIVGMGGVQL